MSALLSPSDLKAGLASLPGWTHKDKTITREYAFPDFTNALLFVNHVGYLAQAADHHPDIDIRYDKVTLTLSTHSAGGLTNKDIALARQIDNG